MNENKDEKANFWPIFFTVFGLQLLFSILGLASGGLINGQSSGGVFFLFIGFVPIVSLIVGIVMVSRGRSRRGSSWIASAFLAPLAWVLIGAGSCFVLMAAN